MSTDTAMQLGMVGAGRMGTSLVRRLLRDGHECVVHDRDSEPLQRLERDGASIATSLSDLAGALRRPRAVWMMLPSAVVGAALDALAPLLDEGDVVIDGGNSYYRDDVARAGALEGRGIALVDCGTSGGVRGLERGFCLMIGGEVDAVRRLDPIFRSLAPGAASAPPTPGRPRDTGTAPSGYLHCGPTGAGHFVKMVHNGIEYGMMAAIAEGLEILRHADAGARERDADAETAPLREPAAYRYELDVGEIAELWRRGSVIQSWLVDLAAEALARSSDLAEHAGRVADSGEGRWTLEAAVEAGVAAPVLAAALFERYASQGGGAFAARVLSAMRAGFGAHTDKP
jgi:6-phosphogluconate dehydrogenase